MVRTPLCVRADSRRRFVELVCIRSPSTVAIPLRILQRLPPRSRLRRRLLRGGAQLFFEAYNRGDFVSAYSLYQSDSEHKFPHQLVEMGFDPVVRGMQANLDVHRRWNADWGEFRIEPKEAIDFGDRVLVLGHIRGSGLSSGAGIENEWANLLTVAAAGRVVRDQLFMDHGEALEAVGLRK